MIRGRISDARAEWGCILTADLDINVMPPHPGVSGPHVPFDQHPMAW